MTQDLGAKTNLLFPQSKIDKIKQALHKGIRCANQRMPTYLNTNFLAQSEIIVIKLQTVLFVVK